MFKPIKVIDVELSTRIREIEGLSDYISLQVLVRLHGAPIGYVTMPLSGGHCSSSDLIRAILEQHSSTIIRHLLLNRLEKPLGPNGLRIEDLIGSSPLANKEPQPLVTVVVCTRDRTDNLPLCLNSLLDLNYPNLDLLVVDNAPKSDTTEQLVRTSYPEVRYVCEPRPGLDWARNRAIIEARGEIIAYTDDDVVVDSGWVEALVQPFIADSTVMAVTGLVVPYEFETEPQVIFERYGGFGRGFKRRWVRVNPKNRWRGTYYGTGQYGTGANMAYRRSLFDRIGYFDPALDVGTVTNGGGDLEMFFRVLKEGYTLVYEPKAIVRHRHRREYAKLRTQITNNGLGLYSYFVRSTLAYPDERLTFTLLGSWWLWWWFIRRLLLSFIFPAPVSRDLIWPELWGSFIGLRRYQQARQTMAEIVNDYGPHPEPPETDQPKAPKIAVKHGNAVAVRDIDVGQPLLGLNDVSDYTKVRIFVTYQGYVLGSFEMANNDQSINSARLCEAIVDHIGVRLLDPAHHFSKDVLRHNIIAALTRYYMPAETTDRPDISAKLPANLSVSVVVATFDRPDDLRHCLRCLLAQQSSRPIEIIVVDNHPDSGLTPPVVAEFPGVVLVNEPRRGSAYARNAGFTTSRGDVIVVTDDDVILPPDWLEKLVAPFARSDVLIVTGNVLPLELETTSQRLFESYGGLGRGFEPLEVNRTWFESFRRAVPTWELGGTANTAFRATIFSHPQIGLLDEALGPGMPSGVGEDTYFFYKVLKAGYTIVYKPEAYVWHKHRRAMSSLRHQIYNYSKGHVAYHLTTLLRDHDLRALVRLVLELPWAHLLRIKARLRGRSDYSLSLICLEIVGNLVGPWVLWRSRRRVKREGCSELYVPVAQRLSVSQALLSADTGPQDSEAYEPTLTSVS